MTISKRVLTTERVSPVSFWITSNDIDAGDNLRYLQEGIHSNHPTYTNLVENKLQSMFDANGGKLTVGDINSVINDLHGVINKAEQSGLNLNKYIKSNF